VDLPAGRRLRGQRRPTPEIWATDDPIEHPGPLWEQLRRDAPALGLVPVVLDPLGFDRGDLDRPWDEGEFGPRGDDDLSGYEPAEIFRERWLMDVPSASMHPADREWLRQRTAGGLCFSVDEPDEVEDEEEAEYFRDVAAPWGVRFPGMALAERHVVDGVERRRALAAAAPGRMGLVATARVADIPYAIGWDGALNHFIGEEDKAVKLSVMMRTWEDRFGAYLFRLGFATMELFVERPPQSDALALAVAAEHFAFAGTDGFQAYEGDDETIRDIARRILGGLAWRFWWD
jgi:hypothetical protein